MTKPDYAGFLKFVKTNKEYGKRELYAVANVHFGIPLKDAEDYVSRLIEEDILMEMSYRTGSPGRPKILVTGVD